MSWWDEYRPLVAGTIAVLAAVWVLWQVLAEVRIWVRARRDARRAGGCAGCGAAAVDVVAYPDGGPRVYCRACVDGWPDDGPEPPPLVGLRRPADGVALVGEICAWCFVLLGSVLWTAVAAGG